MTHRPLALTLLVLAALLGGSSGCSEPPPPKRPPSVLLITLESVRADQLGAEWNGQAVTPVLGDLASGALVYEHTVSPAPWTTPAITSILTGQLPPAHGLEEHDRALAPEVEVVAERFQQAGYRTAAIVSAATLRPAFGLDKGFDVYDYEDFGHERISSPSLIGKVQHRLQQWKEKPFFIWVHLWDPHYNYFPAPPYDSRFARGEEPERQDVQRLKWTRNPVTPAEADYLYGQYQGEVAYTDEHVGQLLRTLEQLQRRENLIVAVVGDHGESFLEHGWLGHTNRLDEVNVHVPLVVDLPAGGTAGRVSQPVSSAQVPASLLQWAGLSADGFGAVPPLPDPAAEEPSDAAASAPPITLTQTRRRGCLTGIVHRDLKLVVDHCSCQTSLFDLSEDPQEKSDIADRAPGEVERLSRLMRERLERIEQLDLPQAALPEEEQAQVMSALKALGYVEQGGGEALGVCEVTDGTERRDTFGDLVRRGPCPAAGALKCLRSSVE